MARLPTSDQLGKRQLQDRSSIVQTSFDSSGQQALVKSISNISERVQRSAVHKAKMDFQKSKLEIDNSFNNDKDFETYETRYNEKVGKAQESALKSVHSPRMRSELADEFGLYQQRGALTIKAKAFDREVKVGLANLDEVLTTGRENYLMATSKQDKEFIRDTMLDAIQDAHEVGYVDDTQAKNMHQAAAKDLAIAQLATETPANQLQLLQGDSDIAKVVPADVRARMTEQAKAQLRQARNETNIKTNEVLSDAKASSLSFARGGYAEAANEDLQKVNEAIDARVSAGIISGEEAKVQKTQAKREVSEEGETGDLLRTFDEEGYNAALEKLDALSDTTPKGYSPEEWDSYIAGAQVDINRKAARQRQITKGHAKEKALDDSIKRGLLFTDPDIPANPAKGSQDKKDVNNYYDSVSPEWMTGDANEIVEKNVEFVKNTGIVPDQLISSMGAVMRSGNAGHVNQMVDTLQRIQASSPNSIKDFDQESRAMSLQISDSVDRGGMGLEDAIESARKNTYGLTATQKEEIRIASAGRRHKKERSSNFKSMVSSGYEGLSFFHPDIPPAMEAAYMSNFANQMTLTNGNIEQSEKLAFEDLKSLWGITNVGGKKRFARHAPESVYHDDRFDDGWIEDQFLEETELLGIADAVIGVDDKTARSDSPSYPIMAPNKNGILDTIPGPNGQPLRFQPDLSKTKDFMDLKSAVANMPSTSEHQAQARKTAVERREEIMLTRSKQIFRGVSSRVFSYSSKRIPMDDRVEFLATEEGKADTLSAVSNMLALGKIDQVEAIETLRSFDAGSLEDMPAYDTLVKEGVINATNN